MNLGKKKSLAARTFGVGESRIILLNSRLEEIKEAITKQDMRDLKKDGAIIVKEIKGRRTRERRKTNRSDGNIRKKIKRRKKDYVILSRKLRKYIKEMREQKRLNEEVFKDTRKKIKNRVFKSKEHLKEYLQESKKEKTKKTKSGRKEKSR